MGIDRLNKMADENYEIEGAGDAGAADTQPMEAGRIRKGGFIMIKGNPCKVVDVSTSKTGKHEEELCPSTHNAEVPFVARKDYQIMSIEDEPYISLMDIDSGECREDLQFPDATDDDAKVVENIKQCMEAGDCDVFATVLSARGQEKIIDVKKSMA